MKKILLLLSLLIVCQVFSQEKIQKYSKAKIYYNSASDMEKMSFNGIAVDHGKHKRNVFIESVFSEKELNTAEKLGFTISISIHDMQKHIANRKTTHLRSIYNTSCAEEEDYETPANFELGSMGGFYTYTQMLQELDDMHSLYPNLITAKAPIQNFLTFENRPIYSVKISDNPTVDEEEPEILFSAIHHAREPASMQQLIFYMWYLLENYASDAEIASIINTTEQYFIPILNPDGYVRNETTNPNGGGMWRKNRRNNGNGTFGVDNNRNYSYHWGEAGTSATSSGETWPGTEGFSEPENQAMKWFCEQHNFLMALNNHSYSELLLYPYGYALSTPSPEEDVFNAISTLMVSENGYTNQIASALYAASGDSDDWMYGDTSTKNKIYAMTPEIGKAFWPDQSKIIGICKEMLFHNITGVHLVNNHAKIEDITPTYLSAFSGNLDFSIKRLGLQEPANFTVSIQPISTNIISVGASQEFTNMLLLEEENGTITFALNSSIQDGDEVTYKIIVDTGTHSIVKNVTKYYGSPQTVFNDSANNTTNFNSTSWETTTATYHSASSSITDSFFGNYANNSNIAIELTNTIDLSQSIIANLSFYTKWAIEPGWDYVQFEISKDNGSTWIPQCGKHTKPGVADQGVEGEPIYDGTQNTWVKEEINLSDYLGENIKFRFQLVSDDYTTADGFYFDDVKIEVINSETASITKNELQSVNVYPNPFNTELYINIPNLIDTATIYVYAVNGQLVKKIIVNETQSKLLWSNNTLGIYFIKIVTENATETLKIIKQ